MCVADIGRRRGVIFYVRGKLQSFEWEMEELEGILRAEQMNAMDDSNFAPLVSKDN